MRSHRARDVLLRRGRQRDEDQFGATQCLADVERGVRDRHCARAAMVDQHDGAGRAYRLERRLITPPQANLVPLLGEVGSRCIAAVTSAKHGDLHGLCGRALKRQMAPPADAQRFSSACTGASNTIDATAPSMPVMGAQTASGEAP